MTRQRTRGFQKPVDDGKRRKVGMAVVSRDRVTGIMRCSCGQPFMHQREKPRENAIDKHIERKHQGRGIRL
jgi:hypothetical protein